MMPSKLLPKSKRLPESKRVTIAAGYHCAEGIVLCADTEETVQDYIKRDVHKIIQYPDAWDYKPENHCCLFAGAGDGPLIDSLALKMWNGVKGLQSPSLDDIASGIEDVLIREYQKLVLSFHKEDMPQAHFLIAIRSAAEKGVELLEATGPVIKRQVPYGAIGYGLSLHTYLASRMLYPKTGLKFTTNVMTYMLDQVKTHVMHCGGETHLYTLNYEGECRFYSAQEIQAKTEALREIDLTARHIAGVAMDVGGDMQQARTMFDGFMERLFEAIKQLTSQT